MTDTRYKAFLSYAHHDEKWARWFHRALESYRMPRRVATRSQSGNGAVVRVGTVFRDRDELSAGPHLSLAIETALAQSENLVVLCSPAAVRSRWVNEEIRHFRRLGKAEHIFCVIVDGEPGAGDGRECFPPALFEGVTEAGSEPLAVDVREWADGKRLARLKLVAALLGVRLEDLRNRDHQRRRRRQLTTLLAGSLAVTLIVVTGTAVLSERRERQRSEELAGTMADLGGQVENVVDLETQRKLISTALGVFENLDPEKLTLESATRVSLVLRQMGSVNLQQGLFDDALTSYRESSALLAALSARHPESPETLNQLSLAHYYVCLTFFRAGEFHRAQVPAEEYERLARAVTEMEPEDLDYRLEHVWALQNLAVLEMKRDASRAVLAIPLLEEAEVAARSIMSATPRDEIQGHYATLLSWLAEARVMSCRYEPAREAHEQAIMNARQASESQPANNYLKRQLAYRELGLSTLDLLEGRLPDARERIGNADRIMRELSTADPSNQALKSNLDFHRLRLAEIKSWEGSAESALADYRQLLEDYGLDSDVNSRPNGAPSFDPPELFIRLGGLYGRLGQPDPAGEWLARVFEMLAQDAGEAALNAEQTRWFVNARWAWKTYTQQPFEQHFPDLAGLAIRPDAESSDCRDIDAATRLAALQGRGDVVRRQSALLAERGYRHPEYLAFCSTENLCEL